MAQSGDERDVAARLEGIVARSLAGSHPTREEILLLLGLEAEGEAARLVRRRARALAMEVTAGTGRVWSAVGLDSRPCPMNCAFCSFGEQWGLVREECTWTDEEVVRTARLTVGGGASWLALRTTEFYSLDRLCALAARVRTDVAGDYALVVNTGELDAQAARRLLSAGVTGVYHSLRLGEGTSTRFDPEVRLATMASVRDAGLELYTMVEPLASEHTNEEIADRLLVAHACRAQLSGVMARINVPGTPLGGTEPVSEARLCLVTAVSRICAGRRVRDICAVPPTRAALESGANTVTIEIGAIPRSEITSYRTAWNDFGLTQAGALLREAGYSCAVPEDGAVPKDGTTA